MDNKDIASLSSLFVAIVLLVANYFQWWNLTYNGKLITKKWVKVLFFVLILILIWSFFIYWNINIFLVIGRLIISLFGNIVFWTAVASIGSIAVVCAALIPIIEKNRLGVALFEDAAQVDIGTDGVFCLHNIFNEPIIVEKIDQKLLCGLKGFNLKTDATKEEIALAIKNIPNTGSWVSTVLNKRLPSGLLFTFAGTLTHLPGAAAEESVWIVESKVHYLSTKGSRRECSFVHRFSVTLEPRDRWVELINH